MPPKSFKFSQAVAFSCGFATLVLITFLLIGRTGSDRVKESDPKHSVAQDSGGKASSVGVVGTSVTQVEPAEGGENAVTGIEVEPFQGFLKWLADYRTQSDTGKKGMIEKGVTLAEARRPLIRRLIHENPEVALAHALRLDQYDALPDEVRALVEAPFSAQAGIDVFPHCDGASAARQSNLKTSQTVDIHLNPIAGSSGLPTSLDAFSFGWRVEAPSRTRTPVQGIHLDGVAAVRSVIFQQLTPAEVPVAERLFAVGNLDPQRGFASGRALSNQAVVALAGGRRFYFSDQSSFDAFEKRAAALETTIGSENGAILIFNALEKIAAAPQSSQSGFDMDAVEAESQAMFAAAAAAPRRTLMLLIDFSDKQGVPIAAGTLQTRMDGEVNNQCRDMSFGMVTLDVTTETALLRMPQPTTYYNGTDDGSKKNGTLYNDALAAAQTAGIDITGYSHRCVMMKGIGMGYCGLATVGGSKIWLPCHGSKVIVHELGHNFGVGHASFHDPDDDNDPLGAGSTSEYGDNTDIMGGGGVSAGHFHPQFKTKLSWLDGTQRFNFNSGDTGNTYRIFRFDHPDTDEANAKRAIRVYRGSNNEYLWLGYRQRYTNSNFRNYAKGLQIHWQKAGSKKSWLVDTTPGGGKNNSGLGLGRTFSDSARDIHITTLKRGGSGADSWLDVEVNRGPFAGNAAPTVSIVHVPNRVPINQQMPVGATATDPDNDPLVYSFDFKDNDVSGSDGTLDFRNYTWTSTGNKNLVVTVSDRKGRTASRSVTVTVQSAIAAPTGLTASDSTLPGVVEVDCNTVAGATSYSIYRSASDSVTTAVQIGSSSAANLPYVDTSADPETTYYYWVQALGSSSASVYSGSDAGRAQAFAPQLDLTSASQVTISWPTSPGGGGYSVYRGPNTNSAQAFRLGGSTTGSFADDRAIAGDLYYWFVQPGGTGALSEPASGRRIFEEPPGFALAQTPGNEISMSWSQPPGSVEGYELRRSTGNDVAAAEVIAEPALAVTAHADTTLPRGVTLYYWVRAKSASTAGEWSAPLSVFSMSEAYAEFVDRHNLSGEDALPESDPDKDGVTNFEEWAQGNSDPTSSAAVPTVVQKFQTISGTEYFTLSYLRIQGGVENGSTYQQIAATYEAAGGYSTDSLDQSPVAATAPAGLPDAPSGYEWGCFRMPQAVGGSGRGFMRLSVNPAVH